MLVELAAAMVIVMNVLMRSREVASVGNSNCTA